MIIKIIKGNILSNIQGGVFVVIHRAIKPYNDLWLDCVSNNLIAMLIYENESFINIPCYMDAVYLKKVLHQSYSSEDIQGGLVDHGAYFPKIQYSQHLLTHLIYRISGEQDILGEKIHTAIKEKLDDGFFVFITVDRFFYPSGVNSKISHMVHPAFIYGYNDEEGCYHSIEDCITMGKMDYYNIPFTSLDQSIKYFKELDKNVDVSYCRVNESDGSFKHHVELSQVIKSLEITLYGGQIYNKNYDLYYHSGIDALTNYLEEFEYLFFNLKDENQFKARTLSFCQLHERNRRLTQLISESYGIDISDIDEIFIQLQRKWESFKNRSYYLLEIKRMNGVNHNHNDLEKLRFLLESIIELERSAAESLLLLCKKS
ncbi:hypothetical protein [Paenibacillus borealis]|uniref:Butirosin biosynthesis protein H N-terminal domain-containing protein n=1 Tax=Paenibacillus borealis TaxID=160799 RepID=A0A089L686_PAEBO|nr:hypothetical protein [Paenibacillus borealis]AIQ56966.1 hypothetical protein PBOR_08500 [Paenibacillus borealis]